MKRLAVALVTLAALAALSAWLPGAINAYYFRILMLAGIAVILSVSLNLINGFTGQFSIGHAGFMAIGGYCSAIFTMQFGSRWLPALAAMHVPDAVSHGALLLVGLLLGGLLAAGAGYLVGLPSLRLRGDYLAIVTLGFGEIIRVVILNINHPWVRGSRGLSGIPKWTSLFWVGAWVAAVIALSANLARSTHGRALFAIRDDEVAAEALGVNTTRYKVLAFVLGSFFAGVAGGLGAHYNAFLDPASFTFMASIEVIAMVVLGGMGSISGSVLGAVVLTLLPELLRPASQQITDVINHLLALLPGAAGHTVIPVKDYRLVIYALLLVVLMITRPQGLMGTRELSWFWKRRRHAVAGSA